MKRGYSSTPHPAPFSTGAVVAAYANKAGLPCICVYSAQMKDLANLTSLVPHGLEVHFDEVILINTDPNPNLNSTLT